MKPSRSSNQNYFSRIFWKRQESGNRKINATVLLLALVAVSLIGIPPAGANAAPPLTKLSFFFENNSVPVNENVNFTMNCSAFACDPATGICPNRNVVNRFGDIFSFFAICPSYGCFHEMHATTDYELLTSCDFIGETGGKGFVILNYTQPTFSCRREGERQSCDLTIDISSGTLVSKGMQPEHPVFVTGDRSIIQLKSRGEQKEPAGGIDAFICFVKNLFGRTC